VGYLKYSLFHKFVARLTELYRVVFAVSNEWAMEGCSLDENAHIPHT
jgi:hypothetical protein